MAAHKSLSLRRNMHLGRLSECLHAYQTASEMTVHERAFCGTTCRSNPLFKLDYFLKRKSEHPQSRTDRGRYQDLETGKRESQSFHFKAVIFFRLPVLSLLSPPLKHTCTNTHTPKALKQPHRLFLCCSPRCNLFLLFEHADPPPGCQS